jgi:hypothetical protein
MMIKELLSKLLDEEDDSLKRDFSRFIAERLFYHNEELSNKINDVTQELLKNFSDDERIFKLFLELDNLINQRSTDMVDSAYIQGLQDGIRLKCQ